MAIHGSMFATSATDHWSSQMKFIFSASMLGSLHLGLKPKTGQFVFIHYV